MADLGAALHQVDDVIGLIFGKSGAPIRRYFRVVAREMTGLAPYSLGAASAMAVAGTGWNLIQSSDRDYLVPNDKGFIYQNFFGITPSYAWVYHNQPSGVVRGSLIATLAIGNPVGYMTGVVSPFGREDPATMFHTTEDSNIEFLGYHPAGEPASITIQMSFVVNKLKVVRIGDLAEQLPPELRPLAKVFSMGGVNPAALPEWLSEDFKPT